MGGMSRIRLTIDRLVLNGFDALEGKALSEALRAQLSLAQPVATGPRNAPMAYTARRYRDIPIPRNEGSIMSWIVE